MRRLLTVLAVLAATVTVGPAEIAQAGAPAPTPCTGVISITSLAFNPPSIAAGNTSTATLAATNCTAQRQQVSSTWVGRFANAAGSGIPQGCPVIDPLPMPLDFPPYGSLSKSVTYLVFKGCTASVLHLTVTIASGGQVLATRSADLQITH